MEDAYTQHKEEIEKLDSNLKHAFVAAKDSINNITEASKQKVYYLLYNTKH